MRFRPLALALAAGLALATPAPAHAGNGCGAGPTARLVPDRPLAFPFRPACDAHDRCYATPWRRVEESRFLAKRRCDRRFLRRMKRICLARYVRFRYRVCRIVAWVYYRAVRGRLSDFAYARAQARRG